MINLLVGGLTVFGYIAALIIGGEGAEVISDFIYNKIFTLLIYTTSVTVLFGLAAMYIGGEYALKSGNKTK